MFFIISYDDEIRQFLFTILNATNIVIIFLISKLFRTFFQTNFIISPSLDFLVKSVHC